MNQLQRGEEYQRYVYRSGGKNLFVVVEHVNERDCQWEEYEAMHYPPEEVVIVAQMVITSVLVGKIAINGETVYESVPQIQTIFSATGGDDSTDDEDDDDCFIDDSDWEIPF